MWWQRLSKRLFNLKHYFLRERERDLVNSTLNFFFAKLRNILRQREIIHPIFYKLESERKISFHFYLLTLVKNPQNPKHHQHTRRRRTAASPSTTFEEELRQRLEEFFNKRRFPVVNKGEGGHATSSLQGIVNLH